MARALSRLDHLERDVAALKRAAGLSAVSARRGLEAHSQQLADQTARSDEADAALVEVAGITAEQAAAADELMAAMVELAGIVAGNE